MKDSTAARNIKKEPACDVENYSKLGSNLDAKPVVGPGYTTIINGQPVGDLSKPLPVRRKRRKKKPSPQRKSPFLSLSNIVIRGGEVTFKSCKG